MQEKAEGENFLQRLQTPPAAILFGSTSYIFKRWSKLRSVARLLGIR